MRKISREDLITCLEMHRRWLMSDGFDGMRINLSGVKLKNSNLSDINLSHANLQGAGLQGAKLFRVDLTHADLRGANLTGTDFWQADLRGAKLDQGIVSAWSIARADFTPDALPWLMLRKNWSEEQQYVHISDE